MVCSPHSNSLAWSHTRRQHHTQAGLGSGRRRVRADRCKRCAPVDNGRMKERDTTHRALITHSRHCKHGERTLTGHSISSCTLVRHALKPCFGTGRVRAPPPVPALRWVKGARCVGSGWAAAAGLLCSYPPLSLASAACSSLRPVPPLLFPCLLPASAYRCSGVQWSGLEIACCSNTSARLQPYNFVHARRRNGGEREHLERAQGPPREHHERSEGED